MTGLARHCSPPLDGEILSRRETVHAVARLRPFRGAVVERDFPAGLSIAEIIAGIPGLAPGVPLLVWLGDSANATVVSRRHWPRVRPKAGTTVTIWPALHDDAWKVVAQIAIAVAAIAATVFLGPVWGAVAAVAITVGGNLAVNALFPARPPKLANQQGQFDAHPSIAGARNEIRLYDPVPVVLGTHRISPPHAARPYTEIAGDDQFLRLLLTPGYGPLTFDPASIKVGETPLLATFTPLYEIRYGLPGDTGVSIYPQQDADEQQLSIELHNTGVGESWETRATATDCDQFSVDITAPEGVFGIDDDGNPYAINVQIEVQHAVVGSGVWIDDGTLVFAYKNGTARQAMLVTTGARLQYDVRVRRLTQESANTRIVERMVWTALRSFTNEQPVTFPKPLALIALRIKASGELSGEIETINLIARSLVTAFNGTTWVADQTSSNPADLYRHVLQGAANARPIADDLVDFDSIEAWWAYCDDEGFEYNAVLSNRTSVYAVLAEIAAAGRARPAILDGKWGVIWERFDAPVVTHITPRNSWGFSASPIFPKLPHGLRCRFINELNGYTEDERTVYDDGYSAANATIFEAFEFPGVTHPDLIYRHARFHLAQMRLRRERVTVMVDWENLLLNANDRVRLTHDVALIGSGSGRVKSVAGQTVVLDEILTLAAATSYAIRFRLSDGTFVLRSVLTVGPAETDALDLVGVDIMPAGGDLFAFGVADQESAVYRVYSIEPQRDLTARLTLVEDAPDIALADTGAIPAYDPHVTLPLDPLTFPPRDFQYIEIMEGYGPSIRAIVRLSWRVPRFAGIQAFQVQERFDDASTEWFTVGSILPPNTSIDVPLASSGVHSYRVRALFNSGSVSTWATLAGLNLAGLSSPPGDIVNLHERLIDGQTHLGWDIVTDPRVLRYEVRKGTSWDAGLVVGDEVAQPPWPTTGDGTYHVRAYVLSAYGVRIYSEATASILVGDTIKDRNIILQRDEQALGWPGALDGGVIDGSFIRTSSAGSITQPWAEEIVTELGLAGVHIAIYVSPAIVDIGRAAECRFWTEFEAVGVQQGDDFLAQGDVLGNADVLGSATTRFIRAFPIWRFANDGALDAFAPADIFPPTSTDIFSAAVEWGDWVGIASGTRKQRYFQPGFVLITDREDVDATGTKYRWFVDVPDRVDLYTDLTVPAAGLALTFFEGGYNATPPGGSATPFNGGPNGSTVPHASWSMVPPTQGDDVEITSLTAAGCTVKVKNGGIAVDRAGVNLIFFGY